MHTHARTHTHRRAQAKRLPNVRTPKGTTSLTTFAKDAAVDSHSLPHYGRHGSFYVLPYQQGSAGDTVGVACVLVRPVFS